MDFLILFSSLVFIAYLTGFFIKFKYVPKSLSDTYYILEKRGFLFTVMMFLIGFSLVPVMIEYSKESLQFLGFLTPAAICFVGAAPNFRELYERDVHMISAKLAAVFGISWVIFSVNMWWVLPISVATVLLLSWVTKSMKTGKTFWLEMVAFISVYLSIILY